MTNDISTEQNSGRRIKRVKPQRTEFLGNLHRLLTKGLPDLVDEENVLDVKKLADHLGISYQAVYKFFQRDKMPAKRVAVILALSKKQKKRAKDFTPLERDDFWEFISK